MSIGSESYKIKKTQVICSSTSNIQSKCKINMYTYSKKNWMEVIIFVFMINVIECVILTKNIAFIGVFIKFVINTLYDFFYKVKVKGWGDCVVADIFAIMYWKLLNIDRKVTFCKEDGIYRLYYLLFLLGRSEENCISKDLNSSRPFWSALTEKDRQITMNKK